MARSIVLSNGHMLVGLDSHAQMKDLYFPYIGQENQTGGQVNKIVLLIDGEYTELSESSSWRHEIRYEEGTLASQIRIVSAQFEMEILVSDVVYNETNIFLRRFEFISRSQKQRLIKIFFAQHFEISSYHQGDTAFYHPRLSAIIHYKGKRHLLVNGMHHGSSASSFTVEPYQEHAASVLFLQAKQGALAKRAIEYGKLESMLEFTLSLGAEGKEVLYFWITAGKDLSEVYRLNEYVLTKTPEHLLETTRDFWRAWVEKQDFHFYHLPQNIQSLFKTSLLICRSHLDNHGAVIASTDSDILRQGRDTYNYMWPRDAAFVVMALDKAGYYEVTKRFFYFCSKIIESDGFFYHKYLPDGSLGSSWHPWQINNEDVLPIQEDELALVLCALWHHYKFSRDIEMVEELYQPLVAQAADFMIRFREPKTHLPGHCYDLWEERFGIFTFTASTVYCALLNASRLAEILGKQDEAKKYREEAQMIQKAIMRHLYDKETGCFLKQIHVEKQGIKKDTTLDSSSIYGIVNFKVLPADDTRVSLAYNTTRRRLTLPGARFGFVRYAGDKYRRADDRTPGNPWIVCSLWYADYLIRKATNYEELQKTEPIFEYIASLASPSNILPEQIHPQTHEHISVSPLIWSHSSFVTSVMRYLQKLNELGICSHCGNSVGELKA